MKTRKIIVLMAVILSIGVFAGPKDANCASCSTFNTTDCAYGSPNPECALYFGGDYYKGNVGYFDGDKATCKGGTNNSGLDVKVCFYLNDSKDSDECYTSWGGCRATNTKVVREGDKVQCLLLHGDNGGVCSEDCPDQVPPNCSAAVNSCELLPATIVAACTPSGHEAGNCDDEIDNDCNGDKDCDDVSCIESDVDCAVCGDTFITPGAEVCDINGNKGCDYPTPICRADCKACVAGGGVCGNGDLDPGETCDTLNNKGCDDPAFPICQAGCGACIANPAVLCGNGNLDPGETCDTDGDLGCVSPLVCRPGCKVCGTPGGAPVCTEGGLIPCGRNCDDINTPDWDESHKCTPCHIILLGQLIIEFLVKMAGIAAIICIVAGGLILITSFGRRVLMDKVKSMIQYVLLGFIIIFIAWSVVNSILVMMGYINPIGGDWYIMGCDLT